MPRHLAATPLIVIGLAALFLLLAGRADASRAHASGGVTYMSKSYQLTQPDQKRRLTVHCPGQTNPLGGGMVSAPPSSDGTGIYPHSYERLGVQHGWHTTAVLFAPHGSEPRDVTMQVACVQRHEHVTPPHQTTYVGPGQTKTVVATCPGRRFLFGGGYQRTDFVSRGGDYVTESRAISPKSWSVTAHAFGGFGGQVTAIAYCWRSRGPLLSEVSASTSVPTGTFATADTPPCPVGHIVFGGFSSPSGAAFMTNGSFDGGGGWSASAWNHFGPDTTLTAYGYCLKL